MNFYLLFALISFSLKRISGTVLGIDFGTEYIKSSLISPGRSFLIIEDTTSKRKTPSSLCFYQNKRFYEYECASKRHRVPQSTFLSLKKYLQYSSHYKKEIQEYTQQNYEFLNLTFNDITQRYQLQFNPPLENQLTFQEITSMVLKHVQQNAQIMTNILPKDVVLTIPYQKDPIKNIYQRQALLEACKLADLNLLGFIHENIAANLYYAVERLDAEPVNILIINIGSGSMQVSISTMVKVNSTEKKEIQTLNVLSQVEESLVNGYVLDQIIARILAQKFDVKRKGQPSILENNNTMIKLHKESEKIKEVLSANKEMNVFIENLYQGEDFHSIITRQEFEQKFEQQFEELINKTLEEALFKANLTLKEINQVELVGGVIRIPKIQQIIQQFIGNELEAGQHLNGDETMACGAAFYAANMSQSFRVRPLQLYDGFDFSIILKITSKNITNQFEKQILLFEKKSLFGSRKAISFQFNDDLQFELIIVKDDQKEFIFKRIQFNNITNITTDEKYSSLGNPLLYFQFILSNINIIELEMAEAELIDVQEVTVQESLQERQERLKKIYQEEMEGQNFTETDQENQQEQFQEEQNQTIDKTDNQNEEELSQEQSNEENSQKKEEIKQEQSQEDEQINVNETENNTTEINENITDTNSSNSNSTKENKSSWADYYQELEKELLNQSEIQTKTKIINTTHYITLSQIIEPLIYNSLNESEFDSALSVIKSLDSLEEIVKKNSEAKNTLETLIYEIQRYEENKQFLKHSTDKESKELFDLISEYEDWLYSTEGIESNYTEFNSRHLNIYLPYKEILNRMEHTKERPDVIKTNKEKLEKFYNKSGKLNNTMPWVNPEEIQNLTQLISETNEWFLNIIEEQKNISLTENPLFTKDDVKEKIQIIENEFSRIKKIKKPKNKTKKAKKTQETMNEIDENYLNDLKNLLNENLTDLLDENLTDLLREINSNETESLEQEINANESINSTEEEIKHDL